MNPNSAYPSQSNSCTIAAIIVTYNPTIVQLKNLLEAITPQVNRVLLIDNGTKEKAQAQIRELIQEMPVEFHSLGENKGVAAAQNLGIRLAKNGGVDFVILFDHDSLPTAGMVATLLSAHQTKDASGERVGVVAPWFEDIRRPGESVPFVRISGIKLLRMPRAGGENIIRVNHVIASGSLMSMNTLDAVGLMREELFIDNVDIEWCERARYLGYESFGVCSALMYHSLGDDPQITYGNKTYCFHSPTRLYYQMRNTIWLYRKPYPGLMEKTGNFMRLCHRFLFYILFAKPRGRYLKMMTRGALDGLLGRLGELRS
jgi:rhamnosyltransferase